MPSPVDTHLAAAAAGLVAGLALYRLARGSPPPPVHQVSAYEVLRASVDAEDDRAAEGHAYDETLAVQGQAAEPMADYDKRTASGSHYVTRIVLTGAGASSLASPLCRLTRMSLFRRSMRGEALQLKAFYGRSHGCGV